MKTKVRTNPAEIQKYKQIRDTLNLYQNAKDAAYKQLEAAYFAENRPMVCDPLNDSEEKIKAFFAPKSDAITNATKKYRTAFATWRKVCLILGGAKTLRRLHQLEMAGVLDD